MARAYHNKRLPRYGLTRETYAALLIAALGQCAICGSRENTLCIDHCHQTGHVRGLLCGNCNRALGGFQDNAHLLSLAAVYLRT